MIKNKMAKLVGTAMAAALMFSAIAPTIESSAMEVEGTTVNQEFNQELAYAIEETRIFVDYLENKDLANRDNRDYALAFASAAVERVRGMENEGHVKYINDAADRLRQAIDIADRLAFEMQSIKDAFEDNRDIEYKKTVLGYLNGSLSEIVHSHLINKINETTLTNANNFLHEYAGKLNEKDTSENVAEESNIDAEQLGYAIEEMTIAINIMDNDNLIDRNNYDRMVIFANTAVQRVSSMDQDNEHVKDIIRLAGEISSLDNTILRRVMNDVECLQNASEDTKDQWINALNEAITYARQNHLLNYNTLVAATDVLHQAAGVK